MVRGGVSEVFGLLLCVLERHTRDSGAGRIGVMMSEASVHTLYVLSSLFPLVVVRMGVQRSREQFPRVTSRGGSGCRLSSSVGYLSYYAVVVSFLSHVDVGNQQQKWNILPHKP